MQDTIRILSRQKSSNPVHDEFTGHTGGTRIDPKLQNNVLIPYGRTACTFIHITLDPRLITGLYPKEVSLLVVIGVRQGRHTDRGVHTCT